ncbi:hypothetical protein TrRE_jg12989 [Triparma retinervis]|uniref:Checkpoint protein n=1 Tax=Triparma retinervis TaxID=2557542 RepID=A0A9W7AS08_9STRA|nr:hypothetical protein TrRE_jg12989 [Triparma retinervis]
MRFKARTTKASVSFLVSLLSPLARLSETSYIKIDPKQLRISTGGGEQSGLKCFTEVSLEAIFHAYKIESMQGNQILVECDLNHLRSLLSSILTAMTPSSTCLLKLAKRNLYPVIVVEKEGGDGVDVKGEVPVRVLQVNEFSNMLPPKTSVPDVQVVLPPASNPTLRNVLEKMKGMAGHVYVEGSMSGDLSFSSMKDGVAARVFFNGLKVAFQDCKASAEYQARHNPRNSAPQDDTTYKCVVKVEAKRLLEMFRWQIPLQKWVTDSTLCMVEDEMLILHCQLPVGESGTDGTGGITFYGSVGEIDKSELGEEDDDDVEEAEEGEDSSVA